MTETLFPLRTSSGTIELMRPTIPRLHELVDLWSDYLEYWDQTGGIDEAGSAELEQAHQAVQRRAEEILLESAPDDLPVAYAWSNIALASAKEIRQQVFSTEPGEVNV